MERSFQSTKSPSPKFLGGASYVGLDFLGRMKEGNEKEGLRGEKKGRERGNVAVRVYSGAYECTEKNILPLGKDCPVYFSSLK